MVPKLLLGIIEVPELSGRRGVLVCRAGTGAHRGGTVRSPSATTVGGACPCTHTSGGWGTRAHGLVRPRGGAWTRAPVAD